MAVLDAIQSAILRADGSQVQEVYASTEQICIEMADLANDVATDIMKSQDWRDLTKIHTITGDGLTFDFPLPADFDRMVMASYLQDNQSWFWGYYNIPTVNEWMEWKQSGFLGTLPGGWIMLAGQMSFVPAPTGSASYPYVSKLYAKDANGIPKAQFTHDTDTFVLDERLITLGCIWRWREQKGLEYAEDMQNYELALTQAQSRDKGARVIRSHDRRRFGTFGTAYPWPLG